MRVHGYDARDLGSANPHHAASVSERCSAEAHMLQGKYPLFIALVLGLLAGLIAYSAITAKEKAVRLGWAVKHVLCASKNIDEGTEFSDDSYNICEMPEKFVTDSFIPAGEDESGEAALPLGQKLIVPLKRGDPILYSYFESRKDVAMAEAVTPRFRAISIDVSEKSSVNQLIKPNDHVDVVGTFRSPDGKELVATTVLQNIIVLATGRTTGTSVAVADEDKKYSHVALLVLPEEAEILALAGESGTMSLTLRNPLDIATEKMEPNKVTTVATLTSHDRQNLIDAVKPAIAFKLPTSSDGVTIISGSNATQVGRDGLKKEDK
jgi:pilus assembly protein CpaB